MSGSNSWRRLGDRRLCNKDFLQPHLIFFQGIDPFACFIPRPLKGGGVTGEVKQIKSSQVQWSQLILSTKGHSARACEPVDSPFFDARENV